MKKKGWAWKPNCTKRHYFINGKSLCKAWPLDGCELTQGYDDIPENCKKCQRELTSIMAAKAANEAA